MIEKTTTKLIYLLLILYPTGLLLRFKIFTNTQIVPQDIIVFFILILTVFHFIKTKRFPKSKFMLLQIGFIIIGTLSLLVNSLVHPDIKLLPSFLYPFRYIAYLSLFIAPLSPKSLNVTRKLLLFSGFAVLLIGFWQFFFYYDLVKLFYLGWDNHLYRMFGSFLDPNFAGMFLVLFLFFLFGKISKEKFINVYCELILFFFTLIAVYLTFSRTALVALFSGVVAYGLITKKYKIILIVIVFLFSFLLIISDTHTEGLNPFRTASTSSRIISIKESAGIISKDPIFGVGFNAYRYAQIRYGYRNLKGASLSNADAGTDNSFILALATSGVAGFICYSASWYFLGWEIVKKAKTSKVIIISTLIALFAGSLFTNVLFYTPILTFLFLFLRVDKLTVEK